MPQVLEATGMTKSEVYEDMDAGKFPLSFKLSEGGRAIGWWADEIEAYQEARAADRKQRVEAA